MSTLSKTLDCGCAYELKPSNSLVGFSSDVVLWCTALCPVGADLVEVWRDSKDEAAREAYYDHVWASLAPTACDVG